MGGGRRAGRWLLAGAVVAGLTGPAPADAEESPSTLRLALVSQWVVRQHHGALPALRQALDGGVVDRTVFQWQRGRIQRAALVDKPVRVLAGPVVAALGGRGEFELGAIRPPSGSAAWTEVDVVPRGAGADGVAVLEIGAERNTVGQVLETLLVAEPGGGFRPVGLARVALFPGDGVPVVSIPSGEPLAVPGGPGRFRDVGGMALLVARSPVAAVVNGGITAGGPADVAGPGPDDWRQGDRVFVRVPAAVLRAGAPPIVLGWKDRTLRDDPDPELLRRSSWLAPLVR